MLELLSAAAPLPVPWLLAALALLLAAYLFLVPRPRLAIGPQLAVVISGCDSGFGEALALRCAGAGFSVFAGCLTPEGLKRFKGVHRHLHAFPLDVTQQRSVAVGVEGTLAPWLAQDAGRSLHALVNNAGVGASGLVAWAPLEGFRRTMEVNFLGHVAVTQAHLPLLMRAAAAAAAAGAPPPRIINVTSIAGILAAPGLAAYSASKFALEAFSDALRREMAPWRLRVAIIEPSFLATPILAGVREKSQALWDSLSPAVRAAWGLPYFTAVLKRGDGIVRSAEPASLGVEAMFLALTHVHPHARYRAGTPGRTYLPLIAALPAWASDAIIARSSPSVVPEGMRRGGQ
jgi:11-cis-retinol dehydrogenase